jgi:hypothetical protein
LATCRRTPTLRHGNRTAIKLALLLEHVIEKLKWRTLALPHAPSLDSFGLR